MDVIGVAAQCLPRDLVFYAFSLPVFHLLYYKEESEWMLELESHRFKPYLSLTSCVILDILKIFILLLIY